MLGLLASAAMLVDDFERAARHALYGTDVRVALRTGVQEVVLTGGTRGRPLRLFLDGRLRVSGRDEHRYHEALVHPAMNGPHARVLILGGGDGLAAREVLRHSGVRRVDIVEPDADVVRLARHDAALSALNRHVYDDARVHEVTADVFSRLREVRSTYDVVVSDLPDPDLTASTKLYSQEFYGLARRVLAPGGRLVVHAARWPTGTGPSGRSTRRSARPGCSPGPTVSAAGTRASRPDPTAGQAAPPGPATHGVRGFRGRRGRLGFHPGLAYARPLRLDISCPRLRTLTQAALTADARAAYRSRFLRPLPPSTLVHPRYTD